MLNDGVMREYERKCQLPGLLEGSMDFKLGFISHSCMHYVNTHTHTHTHTHIWFTIFVGTLHRRKVFLYCKKLYIIFPYINSIPKPTHHRKLSAFLFLKFYIYSYSIYIYQVLLTKMHFQQFLENGYGLWLS